MARAPRGRWATPSRYPRTARLNEVLREIIASELERTSYDDDRLELVTVTGVDTNPDLRNARVFFSALDTKATGEEVLVALEELRVRLQGAVAKSVRLKRTPLLIFVPDPAIEAGLLIEDKLRALPPPSPELPDPDVYSPAADNV